MDDIEIPDGVSDKSSQVTKCKGSDEWCKKSLLVYITQVLAIFIIVIVAIVNLSTSTQDKEMWLTLLCTSMGYLLPNPKVKAVKTRSS